MLPLTIIVVGKASERVLGEFVVNDPHEKLMFFLLRHGLPIASSCAGDGVCRKCVVNGDKLSCQLAVGEWPIGVPVEIGYL